MAIFDLFEDTSLKNKPVETDDLLQCSMVTLNHSADLQRYDRVRRVWGVIKLKKEIMEILSARSIMFQSEKHDVMS